MNFRAPTQVGLEKTVSLSLKYEFLKITFIIENMFIVIWS